MQYQFIRFDQSEGVRRFAFDCIAEDHSVLKVVVRADVMLARKYDIRLQDLPLLCRRLLAELPPDNKAESVTFSEAQMRAVQTASQPTTDPKQRKAPRVSANTGHAWR